MKLKRLLLAALLLLCTVARAEVEIHSANRVNLTHDTPHVDVFHRGKPARIERNPDTDNMLDPDFMLTSRPCPPYCIQPMQLAPGVETMGELELIEYLRWAVDDATVLVIDSRDGDWPLRSGVIPGATLLPWQELHPAHSEPEKIAETLIFRFGAAHEGALWNFENAKILVFYCNGPWCGQSPTNIKQLLVLGYPPHKLKWYRGGMQDWKMLGLATVPPEPATHSPVK